ncbi:MAG TPA: DUF3006 domain-containing protein [Longimicrobiaceae bacterium]|jgi:hypothetical protein|nr:DUF3006 domain-containing protein [Longimicrobiaceae bacterium]
MPDAPASPDLWYVDRFEGDLAVVMRGTFSLNVPRIRLPAETREGDRLRLVESEDANQPAQFVIDGEATAVAGRRAGEVLREMRRRDDGADVVM